MPITPDTPLIAVVENPAAKKALLRFLPSLADSPVTDVLAQMPLRMVVEHNATSLQSELATREFWSSLAAIDSSWTPPVEGTPIPPDPDYEGPSVPVGSAQMTYPEQSPCWDVFELTIAGPDHANPFVDVELSAVFSNGDRTNRVGGFYDGDGQYLIRFMPDVPDSRWTFRTESTARSLDALEGSFHSTPARAGVHGPVRVVDHFHFAYADGTRFTPAGTTAYAWTHQSSELEERTLHSLAASPFNKVRMGVFPKSYLFNRNEPLFYPFPGSVAEGWDTTRFLPDFFRHLETRISQLGERGIQADVILLHPYDRWGFSRLGRSADTRLVEYVVRRLAAYHNVWWSMANEYDLMWSKTTDDWEHLAGVVQENDPHEHLLSIHNCFAFYDYSRPWITHCSVQRVDVYRTAEETTLWRDTWHKPVVVDECGYEGDLDQGWGNLPAQELVRRCWEGAVRGGYVAHGETYLNDREELFWSKGGEFVGDSPARIGFLTRLIAESPTSTLEPLDMGRNNWDLPFGGVSDQYYLAYFGFNQPRYRHLSMPPGQSYTVDVVDTWNMTVDRLPSTFSGNFRVDLPGRQYMALRLIRADA